MGLKLLFKKIKRIIRRIINRKSDSLSNNEIRECYICGKKNKNFYEIFVNKENDRIVDYFQLVGSDTENYGCHYCDCNDRERHLFMYFDRLSLWDKFKDARILHFAPENPLSKKIEQLLPLEYVKCDLFPKEDWIKIDITKIDFEDNSFDIVICNHIIEHIPNYIQAFKEISRVLKENGFAILQTPYSDLLYNHFEDSNINTDELRLLFYGQEDHVRIVSKRQFLDELSQYFTLNIVENNSLFTEEDCFKFGVNKKENLVMVINNKGRS